MKNPKKIFWITVLAALAVAFYWINVKVDRSVQLSSNSRTKAGTADETDFHSTVSDAGDLNIRRDNSDEEMARGQEAWITAMDRDLTDPATVQTMEKQGILNDLKRNPQKIEERLTRIDEEIQHQQVRVRQHPNNPQERSRLESLFMLKATLTTLEQTVTPAGLDKPQ